MTRIFLLAFCLLPLCAPCAPTNQPARVTSSLAVSTNGVVVAPASLTITNLVVNAISGVDAGEVALQDAGGFFPTNNVESALQQLGASIASVAGDITAVSVTNGLLTVANGTGPVPVIGLTTSSVRNATAIYLPLSAGPSKPLTGLLGLNGDGRIGFNAADYVLAGSPDTNSLMRIETLVSSPTQARTILDLTTDGLSESGGLVVRAVNSSGVTNDLLRLTSVSGLDSPYGFRGPGAAITGVNAAQLGGSLPSAFLLRSGGTMTGALNMGDGVVTNVNRIVFKSIGGAGVPYLSSSGTDTLLFTLPGSFTQMVYTTTTGLVPPADLAQGGASSGQTLTWSTGAESWVPTTVTPGVLRHQTGSNTNAIMRTFPLGGTGAKGTLGQGAFDGQGFHVAGEGALAAESFIGGGRENYIRSTALYSFIGGGLNNEIGAGNTSTGYSFLGGGRNNLITVDVGYTDVVLCGGSSNIAGGYASFLGGGNLNSIGNVQKGVVVGGNDNDIVGTNNYGFIGGGRSNKIQTDGGTDNAVVGGDANSINTAGDQQFIGGGSGNSITATGNFNSILGGSANGISGSSTAGGIIPGGSGNLVSTSYGSAQGLYALGSLFGQVAQAAGRFSVTGDAQTSVLTAFRSVTGTSSAELFLDGSALQLDMGSLNRVWAAEVVIVGSVNTIGNGTSIVVGDSGTYRRNCTVKRIGSDAGTSLVGVVEPVGTDQLDTYFAGATVALSADTATGSLKILVTPPSSAGSTTITRWVARVEVVQMTP